VRASKEPAEQINKGRGGRDGATRRGNEAEEDEDFLSPTLAIVSRFAPV
jgi:hypothetical protein